MQRFEALMAVLLALGFCVSSVLAQTQNKIDECASSSREADLYACLEKHAPWTVEEVGELGNQLIKKKEQTKLELQQLKMELEERKERQRKMEELKRERYKIRYKIRKEIRHTDHVIDELNRVIGIGKKVLHGSPTLKEIQECSRIYQEDCWEIYRERQHWQRAQGPRSASWSR